MTDPRPPAELRVFADAIGDEATLLLIEQLGGQTIYVPKGSNQGTQLALQIGLEAAQILGGLFGGEHLRVPLAKRWCARVYRRRGDTIAAIAKRLHCGENTIYAYVSRDRGTRASHPDQLPLF